MDILLKFGGEDADVVQKAEGEAADANIVADLGIQEPMSLVNLRHIARGERVLLHQEVMGHNAQFELHPPLLEARDAEDVDVALVVLGLELPSLREHLHSPNTRRIEEFILARGGLVAPHLNIVRRKAKRLHQAVAHHARMRGGVAPQDHLFACRNGLHQVVDIHSVLALHNTLGQRGAVIDGREFLAQILFDDIRIIQSLKELIHNVGLLIGKVDKLGNILEVAALLAEAVYSSLLAMHHKARLLEGFDVAIDRAVGGAEPFGHILHGVVIVARHHLHKAQHALNLRLFHPSLCEAIRAPLLTKLGIYFVAHHTSGPENAPLLQN